MTYIGFDFSCNKPACCIKINNKLHFGIWPLNIDDKSVKKLEDVNVFVDNRPRQPEGKTSSEKFRWHISMSNDLTLRIIETLKSTIDDTRVMIAFEGSSFGSKGDAALQLAGYRYLLVTELRKLYGLENIYTYAPMTVKSIAGCASKDKKGKGSMITAFSEECIDHPLVSALRNTPEILKKKTNFIEGIDDCVDAFFVLKTLLIKENLI